MSFVAQRKVIEAKRGKHDVWILKLDCGHAVIASNTPEHPRYGRCALCPVGGSSRTRRKAAEGTHR